MDVVLSDIRLPKMDRIHVSCLMILVEVIRYSSHGTGKCYLEKAKQPSIYSWRF